MTFEVLFFKYMGLFIHNVNDGLNTCTHNQYWGCQPHIGPYFVYSKSYRCLSKWKVMLNINVYNKTLLSTLVLHSLAGSKS